VRFLDVIRFALHSIERSPGRTALMLLAMAIGVAAVIVLTGLGEAARRYVVGEFSSLGTNLVIVMPGRSETTGGMFSAGFGGTTRDLTLDDTRALTRSPLVARVSPIVVGAAGVQYGGLEREAPVLGTTSDMLAIRRWQMREGQFLPAGEWSRFTPVAVIGDKVEAELFGNEPAVGKLLRLGEYRFRVIGVLASTGRSIGVDTNEVVIIPVGAAMSLFDTQSMFRVLIEAQRRESLPAVKAFARGTIKARHRGEEDVTVITQDAVLATFDQIFTMLTLAVGGIAGISLAVAGVLIMNVMLVAVSQRINEVGVLKAVGATPRQITTLFMAEAALLSLIGAVVGVGLGLGGGWVAARLQPALDMAPPLWALGAAAGTAVVTGLLFGIAPARRAARLDPVLALARH